MKIGIIVAMDNEFDLISKSLRNVNVRRFDNGTNDVITGRIGKHEIMLSKCGIGKVNAAITATRMLEKDNLDIIVSTGCAGSFGHELKQGDIAASVLCSYWDVFCGEGNKPGQVQGEPWFFETKFNYTEIANSLGLTCTNFVTGDKFVTKETAKSIDEWAYKFADVIDMESAAIAHVCNKYNVDFVGIRIISDVVTNDNNCEQYDDFWRTASNKSFDTLVKFINRL